MMSMFFSTRTRGFPIDNSIPKLGSLHASVVKVSVIFSLGLAFSPNVFAHASRAPKNASETPPADPNQGPQMSSDAPEDLRKAGAMAEKAREETQKTEAGKTPVNAPTQAAPSTTNATTVPAPTTPAAPPKDSIVTKVPSKFSDADVLEAVRLPDYKTAMKALFPDTQDVRETPLLPLEYGGTTFTGLVGRLLGETSNREFEGLKTRRFVYYANNKANSPVGLAHGSSVDGHGKPIDVFVFYTPGGTVRQVQVQGVPANLQKQLVDGGYLSQFAGHSYDDFEVIRGKKGRIKSKGIFLRIARTPKSDARYYFDKIVRAVRYNTAFMGVAYFITQHPDMADKKLQEFPEQVEVTKGPATAGPEAFLRSKKISGSAVDGKITMHHDDEDSDDDSDDGDDADSE